MVIKVLGSGCPKCRLLEANVKEALADLGIEAAVEKVTDVAEIIEYGVMRTPALVIDEQVKAMGQVLSAAEITVLLK